MTLEQRIETIQLLLSAKYNLDFAAKDTNIKSHLEACGYRLEKSKLTGHWFLVDEEAGDFTALQDVRNLQQFFND